MSMRNLLLGAHMCQTWADVSDRSKNGMIAYRTRLIMPGKHGRLTVAVEVLPITPGISMVEVVKVVGNSVDFYNFYAGLTQQVMFLMYT